MSAFPLFVTCPRGVEPLLAAELGTLGITDCREAKGGVSAQADLEAAYRACLWSRLASRVLLPLKTAEAGDADALYAAARDVSWPDVFETDSSFAIEVAGRTPGIANTHFAALRLKDAIVDSFRAAGLHRPNVDTDRPAIRLHLHMDRTQISLSLDLAGDSLHRRGYRKFGVEAPLKENLACAILARCGWPLTAEPEATNSVWQGKSPTQLPLIDLMCGSGTFLIEGAWMTADIAPGLLRRRWGFEAWLDHQPAVWQQLRSEAEDRRDAGLARPSTHFYGYDLDPRAVGAARANIDRAGLSGHIQVEAGDALAAVPPAALAGQPPGLIVCNPPYGERLFTEAELIKLYSLFGVTLKTQFGGWRCGFFTERSDLTPRLGLRAGQMHALYNGAIACKLLQFDIPPVDVSAASFDAAEDFSNRLRKNLRHLSKWAKRGDINCYRVYDADLNEYAVAVDLYHTDNGELHAYVQEYAAPDSIDPIRAEKRLRGALASIINVLELPPERLHYKLRQSQKGSSQYQRQNDTARLHTVLEHGCRLQVNFDDYLDTGLFLDHRPMRLRLQREAAGKRVLNLFCYTGAASVHAAVGKAAATVSLDLSNTYLDWAQRNLQLNGFRAQLFERPPPDGERLPKHSLIRADCRDWLHSQAQRAQPPQFDLIFLDPPTFSNSKKMEGNFDIRRDHAALLADTMRLLAPGGTLYFSTNRRGFKLDAAVLEAYTTQNITAKTLDEDFKRPPPAHRCWAIQVRHTSVWERGGENVA